MVDIESINLSNESNKINFFRPIVLGNNQFDDDNFVDVCDDEFPSAPVDLSVSHEKINLKNLDMESISVEENALIETYSFSHYPLFSLVYNESTCDEDNPCSSISSSYKLTSQLTQGSEIVHDERENNQIIENSFYHVSSLILHEDKSSN